MEPKPRSDENDRSANQEISHHLKNLALNYHIHRSPPMNAITLYFLKIHLNVIVPTMPRSSKLISSRHAPYEPFSSSFSSRPPPPPPIKGLGRWPVPASMNFTLCMVYQELVLTPMLETFVDHLELSILSDKGYKL